MKTTYTGRAGGSATRKVFNNIISTVSKACPMRPDGNDVVRCVEGPEIASGQNLFLFVSFLFFFSISFLFSYCSFVLFLYIA